MALFDKVKERVQDLWGKEVISEAESYAKALCEEIERLQAPAPAPKARKAAEVSE